MEPTKAMGLVYEGTAEGAEHFLGSCFAFRAKNRFLTARHCVEGRDVAALSVYSPQDLVHTKVAEVIAHPEADIAVLVLANTGRQSTEMWLHWDEDRRLGNDFMAYGFPDDPFPPHKEDERLIVYRGNPTARLFKGYFQRYFEHRSRLPGRYKYLAGEMSTGCPAGLSGGPVFRPMAVHQLCGVVTENFESGTVLHWQERVVENGVTHYSDTQRIINYGLCVMLCSVADWLDQNCPFPK